MSPRARPAAALGAEALRAGEPRAAIAHLGRALEEDPEDASAFHALGCALQQIGEHRVARVALGRAVALAPDNAAARNDLGLCALALGAAHEAARCFAAAVDRDPALYQAWANLASAERTLGHLAEARAACERALALRPDDPELHRLRLLTRIFEPELSLERFHALQREHAARCARDGARVAPAPGRGARLRVGYLSSDLRDHPVGNNVAPLILHHDPGRFEVFLYADHAVADPLAARLRARADRWREVAGLSDDALAATIREDRLDLLIFLAGHLDQNRLRLAARRLAPVQLSMHDLATSAMPEMDYWLSDRYLHPAGHPEPFSERLVRLPVFYCYLPLDDAPALEARRPGPLRLGSFSNPAKLNPAVLALWARILRALPAATLTLGYSDVFSAAEARRPIVAALGALGIEEARLRFRAGRLGRRDHLARVAELDLALDPFPFNGATTTFEALTMGVPVVTLPGARFIARAAGSILHAAGLDELTARDAEDYVRIAVALANAPDRLARYRRELRDRVTASPLCDGRRHARRVERLFAAMVRSARRRRGAEARCPLEAPAG